MRKFLLVTVLMSILVPASGYAKGDVQDLRATFAEILKSFREKNLEAFLGHFHPDAVIFERNRLFPIDRSRADRDDWADAVQLLFDRVINVEFVPKQIDYRVIDNTGMIWGFSKMKIDSRDELASDLDSRFSVTLTFREDRWMIVAWHTSAPPASQD
ncbi:MAG: nuclear transport factor 2 family protein [Acidobacteriota bacterium]|nr:MAG: nuclear transport factor 2 family protein [Acidobacteriota bacterium]